MIMPCTLNSQGGVFLGLLLTLQALPCQLSSRHLSFSENWLCVSFTSPAMYLAWCAQLLGRMAKRDHSKLLQAPLLHAMPSSVPSPLT